MNCLKTSPGAGAGTESSAGTSSESAAEASSSPGYDAPTATSLESDDTRSLQSLSVDDPVDAFINSIKAAAQTFDVKKLEEIFANNADGVNIPSTGMASVLYELVEAFLDLDMMQQLHSKSKFVDVLSFLTKHGLDVNSADEKHLSSRQTVLHVVAGCSGLHSDILRPLLAAGAQANTRNSRGDVPLHLAVARGNDHLGKALIEGGADPRSTNMSGQTPLHLAAKRASGLNMVELLTNCGADPNAQDVGLSTPLHVAVKAGHVELVKELLRAGSNPSLANSAGQTVLHVAAANEVTGIVLRELLVIRSLNINLQDSLNLQTPLHKAVQRQNIDNVVFLLRRGADVNIKDWQGNTALHLAASSRDVTLWHFLLHMGGDVHIQNSIGYTPEQKVAREKNKVALAIIKQFTEGHISSPT